MAGFITAAGQSVSYRGLPRIFEFTNRDGELFKTNCGQAAVATLLTQAQRLAPCAELVWQIERTYPPDLAFGRLGTSRRRFEAALREHGCEVDEVCGEAALRERLDRGNCVALMLGMSAGRFMGMDLPGGHWMIAFGYDAQQIYLTNYGSMPWDQFRAQWRSWVSWLIRMDNRGLAVKAGQVCP